MWEKSIKVIKYQIKGKSLLKRFEKKLKKNYLFILNQNKQERYFMKVKFLHFFIIFFKFNFNFSTCFFFPYSLQCFAGRNPRECIYIKLLLYLLFGNEEDDACIERTHHASLRTVSFSFSLIPLIVRYYCIVRIRDTYRSCSSRTFIT